MLALVALSLIAGTLSIAGPSRAQTPVYSSGTYYLHQHDLTTVRSDPFGAGVFLRTLPASEPLVEGPVVNAYRWTGFVEPGTVHNVVIDVWVEVVQPEVIVVRLGPLNDQGECVGQISLTPSGIASVQRVTATFTSSLGPDCTSKQPLALQMSSRKVTLRLIGNRTANRFLYGHPARPSSFTFNDPAVGTDPTESPGEPDPYRCPVLSGPVDDPLFACQWGLQHIDASDAWAERDASGGGITVAVIDTGLDLQHPDLQCDEKLDLTNFHPPDDETPYSPDDDDADGHGTHVAGIIGACANNGLGIAGVAPDATLMPIKTIYSDDSVERFENLDETWLISDAIIAATDSGAHVINLSIGCIVSGPACEQLPDGVQEALRHAFDKGVVVVAAAGNDSLDNSVSTAGAPPCSDPAIAPHVICVGATNARGEITSYSNAANKFWPDREPHVVVAPGGESGDRCLDPQEGVLSLIPYDRAQCADTPPGYTDMSGTSMAAPHVAGVAALLYDRAGGLRSPELAEKIRTAITRTASLGNRAQPDPVYGWGLVNAAAAVRVIPAAPIPTFLSLAVEGSGSSHQVLQAHLTERNGASVPERTIIFFADGVEIGRAATDNRGQATVDIPPGSRGRNVMYSAIFPGDPTYMRSEA